MLELITGWAWPSSWVNWKSQIGSQIKFECCWSLTDIWWIASKLTIKNKLAKFTVVWTYALKRPEWWQWWCTFTNLIVITSTVLLQVQLTTSLLIIHKSITTPVLKINFCRIKKSQNVRGWIGISEIRELGGIIRFESLKDQSG